MDPCDPSGDVWLGITTPERITNNAPPRPLTATSLHSSFRAQRDDRIDARGAAGIKRFTARIGAARRPEGVSINAAVKRRISLASNVGVEGGIIGHL